MSTGWSLANFQSLKLPVCQHLTNSTCLWHSWVRGPLKFPSLLWFRHKGPSINHVVKFLCIFEPLPLAFVGRVLYILKAVFLCGLQNFPGPGVLPGKECPDSKNSVCFGNHKFWRFLNRQLYTNQTIFDGFVAILAKKRGFYWFFFCENRYKTIKNRPICTKLTVSKLPEFLIFKKPIF